MELGGETKESDGRDRQISPDRHLIESACYMSIYEMMPSIIYVFYLALGELKKEEEMAAESNTALHNYALYMYTQIMMENNNRLNGSFFFGGGWCVLNHIVTTVCKQIRGME